MRCTDMGPPRPAPLWGSIRGKYGAKLGFTQTSTQLHFNSGGASPDGLTPVLRVAGFSHRAGSNAHASYHSPLPPATSPWHYMGQRQWHTLRRPLYFCAVFFSPFSPYLYLRLKQVLILSSKL